MAVRLNLPEPAQYFPLKKGLYEVTPGLSRLGADFGNGPRDALAFQLDSEFPKYRENKKRCWEERPSKYSVVSQEFAAIEPVVIRALVSRLTQEYPEYFEAQGAVLQCRLTGDSIPLASQGAWDALASQVQEDLCVLTAGPDGNDSLTALHLCSPSHWSAEEKVGKNFAEVHRPVPGIEPIVKTAPGLIDLVVHKGPYTRFVWMFATDDRLNHHPEPPPGHDPVEWKGRAFDRSKEIPLRMRLERQVMLGLPEIRSFLFLIRTYFVDGREIRRDPQRRALLSAALRSMSPASQQYKGVAGQVEDVVSWLNDL